ncbi:hypothetical protein GCM10011321_39610 [Youhaiella tibetensis]|nr:hypothetical protein GCM10011321_39610 [Youhaiella tibetensis]
MQGQIDEEFGIGARHERGRIEPERQPVKFLLPQYARHRLTREPAQRQAFEPFERCRRSRLLLGAEQRQAIEAESLQRQKAGVEFRGIQVRRAEAVADRAPGGADGRPAQETPSMAASWAAWFSVMRAETSSSSASPSMTLSSL